MRSLPFCQGLERCFKRRRKDMAGSAQRGKWNNGKYRQWRKYGKHMQRVGKWKFRDDGYLNCYLIKFFFGQQKVCLFLTRILFEWLKILKTTSALGPFVHSTCCIQKAVMDWREIDSQMWICGSFWKSFNLRDWQSSNPTNLEDPR